MKLQKAAPHEPEPHPLQIAQEAATRLGQIDGVAAVTLGGSWARGAAHPDSDVDLGLYYDPNHPPSLAALRELARELDDRHSGDAVTDFGAWGPWINGGAWLIIQGQRVDWLYRDLAKVRQAVSDCMAGQITHVVQPGHPHGFHNHMYLAELQYSRPLYDPIGAIAAIKAHIEPYPPLLKRAIIANFRWQASFALDTSEKAAARGEVFQVVGSLFQCVASLVQTLFALNERYYINEKGALQAISTFERQPADFVATARGVLAYPGENGERLSASVARLRELVAATDMLCEKYA